MDLGTATACTRAWLLAPDGGVTLTKASSWPSASVCCPYWSDIREIQIEGSPWS